MLSALIPKTFLKLYFINNEPILTSVLAASILLLENVEKAREAKRR